MGNTGIFKSYVIYYNDDRMKKWATSGDEPKHADYRLYDKKDGGVGHVHAINQVKGVRSSSTHG